MCPCSAFLYYLVEGSLKLRPSRSSFSLPLPASPSNIPPPPRPAPSQVVKTKEVECILLQKTSTETSAKLQKALESLTTVQVGPFGVQAYPWSPQCKKALFTLRLICLVGSLSPGTNKRPLPPS